MFSSMSAFVVFTILSRFAYAAPPPVRPVTATIAGWESIGCFKESHRGRAIDGVSLYSDAMTVQLCADFCDSKNLPLMGVEYGIECYCAVDFRERNPAPIGNCWLGCAGNTSESCGSAVRINAYRKIGSGTSTATLPVFSTAISDAPSATSLVVASVTPSLSSSTGDVTSSSDLLPSTTRLSSLIPIPTITPLASTAPLQSTTPLPSTISLSTTTSSASPSLPSSTTFSSSTVIPSATPIPSSTPSSSYTFQSCYSDSISQRTLTGKYSNSPAQNIENCAAECAGFTYFGLEYYFECFCGNDLALSSVRVAADECNYECNGNKGQTCGGSSRLSLYSFDKAPAPVAIESPVAVEPPMAVGCFVDSQLERTLPGAVFADDSMTIELCSTHCRIAGARLFGVEYGRECYCGNSIDNAIQAPASECNQPCAGDSTETCGAGNRLNIYKIAA